MSDRHRAPRPASSRVGTLLFTLATACGVWFGLSAPDVSPVDPEAVIDGGGAPAPDVGVVP
jgi:hypothetical protein